RGARGINIQIAAQYVSRVDRSDGAPVLAAQAGALRGLRWCRHGHWGAGTEGKVVPPHSEFAVVLAALPGVGLVWAGALKLRRPFPASLAIVRFGLARRVRPAVGRAAGGVEIAAGTLLLARPQSPWAYAPAIALLALFV